MRMHTVMLPLALLLLISCSLSIGSPNQSGNLINSNDSFIVFTNDGTFYKLNAQNQKVEWFSSLPFKLLSVDISPTLQELKQGINPDIILPTVDGDFLYMKSIVKQNIQEDNHRQLLIEREDVETMLDICFDENQSINKQQYFVYQNYQYFVVDVQNGAIETIEEFFNSNKILDKVQHAIIFVDQKLLKQTNFEMEVKWSVISSKINLLSVYQFAKINKNAKNVPFQHPKYRFKRIGSKSVTIEDNIGEMVFEIQTNSAIMSIFGSDANTYNQMKITNIKRELLAIENKSQPKTKDNRSQQINILSHHDLKKPDFQDFPHSQDFASDSLGHEQQVTNLQICIASQKVMKEISKQKITGRQFISRFKNEQLPTIPYSADHPLTTVTPTQKQPYLFYSLIMTFGFLGVGLYVVMKQVWAKISLVETLTEQKLKNLKEKVGQFQEVGKVMKRMYQINWDRILIERKNYMLFQGRFLNKNCQVYVIPLSGSDIIGMEHKLNNIFGYSHRTISKLYYYTRNDDSLLIFVESNNNYKSLQQFTNLDYKIINSDQEIYRENIRDLVQCIKSLEDMGVEISAFVKQSFLFCADDRSIKINIIPSLIEKQNDELNEKLEKLGISRVRLNLIECIHAYGHEGKQFNLENFEKEKNTKEQENFFLKDFYDYILTDNPSPSQTIQLKQPLEECGNIPQTEKIKKQPKKMGDLRSHPYIWDSKQRILFITEFSNYAETHIDESKSIKMQSHCKKFHIIPFPWVNILHPTLTREINNFRKYDYYSVRDLIRFIRNKLNHYHEIPKQTKSAVGKTPELFLQYFLVKFPKLLPFMYIYVTKKKWKLNIKI